MEHPTDRELWDDAVSGDAEAFGTLFARHAHAIANHCLRATGDWAVAEDLTSIVFLEAWRKRARVVFAGDSVLPWLYGVATNVVRNQRRSAWRHRAALARLAGLERSRAALADASDVTSDERARELIAAVRGLPAREREAVALCVWAGLTYDEAAVALGVPVGTIRSRVARARRRLGRALGDADAPGALATCPPRKG